jgi:hypothetical protein
MSLLQAITRFRQSFIDQRRSPREHVNFPAWIQTGAGPQRRECTVLDISEGGARVLVPPSVTLPREFWIILSRDGSRRRRCRLVWRSNGQIGVAYLGPLKFDGSRSVLH